jgi:hypothetical protein
MTIQPLGTFVNCGPIGALVVQCSSQTIGNQVFGHERPYIG